MKYALIFGLAILMFAIYFGAHYLLYFATVKFFSIDRVLIKRIIFSAIFILAFSFIFSIFVIQWRDLIIVRAIYLVSSFWTGILVNLLLASALVWFIGWSFQLGNIKTNTAILAIVLFIGALLFSFYGLINALNPKIKEISVRIPNLPARWQGKKIVQLSDLHLGAINRDKFFKNIINKVNQVQPEAVLITGDFFDGMDGDPGFVAEWIDKIEAPGGIYFVSGNHETYLGIEGITEFLKKTKARILNDEVVDAKGLKIIGISFPLRGESKNIAETVRLLQDDFFGQPNILLYHSPVQIDEIKKEGINLQLSGHTHQGQIFPFGFITKLIFKGHDHGFYQSGDYSLYTTSGAGTWGPLMRTGNYPEIPVFILNSK